MTLGQYTCLKAGIVTCEKETSENRNAKRTYTRRVCGSVWLSTAQAKATNSVVSTLWNVLNDGT